MKVLLVLLLSSAQFALAANKAPKSAPKAASAPAVEALKCDPSSGKVSFAATAKPGFLNFSGESEGPQGEMQLQPVLKGKFLIPLDKLTTKNSLRDSHMKEKYLETAKFPTAELQVDEVTGFDAAKAEAQTLPFKGQLTVHGVQAPVAGTVTLYKAPADGPSEAAKRTIVELPSALLPMLVR